MARSDERLQRDEEFGHEYPGPEKSEEGQELRIPVRPEFVL